MAKKQMKKGTIIGNYKDGAWKYDADAFNALYPTNEATHVALLGGSYYDGLGTRNLMAKANRAQPGKKNTARLVKSGNVKLKKRVEPGEEIFLSYGSGYHIYPDSDDSEHDSEHDS